MPDHASTFDPHFRPASYFWPLDLKIAPHAFIKGSARQKIVRGFYAEGFEEDIPEELLKHALSPEQREAIGRLHPAMMGGEYLPDLGEDEVEVARITIASTTSDVSCVYARRGNDLIHYRVVDEYGGDTLEGESETESRTPLSLAELVDYFLSCWNLKQVLEMNFEYEGMPEAEVKAFVLDASSLFYPHFREMVEQRIDEWFGHGEWADGDGFNQA